MAGNVYWRGDAPAVSDVWTVTLATVPTGNGVVTVTVGSAGKAVVITYATGEALAVIAQRLSDAVDASNVPEVRELTPSYPGTGAVVTLTGPAGIPVTVVSSTTTGGTGMTATLAHATTATGPNHGDNPANWSTGTLPGTNASELAVVEGGPDVLYGLGGLFSGANAVATLFWRGSTKGGLPRRNTSGGDPGYWEYRQRWVSVPDGTKVVVGDDARPGTDRLILEMLGSDVVTVHKTGTPEEDGVACVDVKGTNTKVLTFNAFGGSSAFALTVPDSGGRTNPVHVTGESTTFFANVLCGAINQRAGIVHDTAVTTAVILSGGVYVKEGGTVAAITAYSGTARLLHSQGSAITCVFSASVQGEPPVLDLSGNDAAPRDLSNTSSFTGGAYVLDPHHTAVLTTVTFDTQSLNASDIGRSFQITRP